MAAAAWLARAARHATRQLRPHHQPRRARSGREPCSSESAGTLREAAKGAAFRDHGKVHARNRRPHPPPSKAARARRGVRGEHSVLTAPALSVCFAGPIKHTQVKSLRPGWTKSAWLWNTRCMRRLRPTIFISVWLLMLAAPSMEAGFGCHATLLVADPPARVTGPPHAGVRVMYLGTNAYLLEARDATLLVDPYFSRMSFLRATLNLRAASEQSVIARHFGNRRIEAMLATHGHFDHLLDVPEIMNRSDAISFA